MDEIKKNYIKGIEGSNFDQWKFNFLMREMTNVVGKIYDMQDDGSIGNPDAILNLFQDIEFSLQVLREFEKEKTEIVK